MDFFRLGSNGPISMKRTYSVDNKFSIEVNLDFEAFTHLTSKGSAFEVLEIKKSEGIFLIEGNLKTELTVEQLNEITGGELRRFDFSSNCHGYALMRGSYFIDNTQVAYILQDDYMEVEERECHDIVVLQNSTTMNWEHTILKQGDMYIDKQGIREVNISKSIDEIIQLEEYNHLQPKFFRKLAS